VRSLRYVTITRAKKLATASLVYKHSIIYVITQSLHGRPIYSHVYNFAHSLGPSLQVTFIKSIEIPRNKTELWRRLACSLAKSQRIHHGCAW